MTTGARRDGCKTLFAHRGGLQRRADSWSELVYLNFRSLVAMHWRDWCKGISVQYLTACQNASQPFCLRNAPMNAFAYCSGSLMGRCTDKYNTPTVSTRLLFPTMFSRASIAFVFVALTAVFFAQAAQAAKGPKITHKIFFDIKHGEKDLGRST